MAWIESHQELAHHPKVARLAHLLDVSVPTAIGHLHCLWWWCMSYADDGDIELFSAFEVAHGAQWPGDPDVFINALKAAGWLDGEQVHDWWDYAGKLVERRRTEAERKRKSRAKDVPGTSAGHPQAVAGTQPTNLTNTTAPTADADFQVFHRERAVRQVTERKRRGLSVRSDTGLARTIATDSEFLEESRRIWSHRECSTCGGSGFQEFTSPGSGGVTVPCREVVDG